MNIENNNSNNADTDLVLTKEQAEAWVFTLGLGFTVCFGLAIYTLITHNLLFNFPDPTLFNSGLTWLGGVGIYLYFATFTIFWISAAIVRYLPDKISIAKIIIIVGIVLFLVSFIVLF